MPCVTCATKSLSLALCGSTALQKLQSIKQGTLVVTEAALQKLQSIKQGTLVCLQGTCSLFEFLS
jgi:hypothetical protein